MKSLITIIILLVAVVAGILGIGRNASSVKGTLKGLPPSLFSQYLKDKNGILIDIRTHEEYEEKHIAGAFNMDVLASDFKVKVDSLLDKSKPCFIYSQLGSRDDKAVKIMQEDGFKELYYLMGGLNNWEFEGYPVVKPQGAITYAK